MRKKKNLEIESLIHKLDLTPAMHRNAVEKFEALKNVLKSKDESIRFYPHGSFMLGTTIRPYKEQSDRDYDLDSICLFDYLASEVSPKVVRELLENIFKELPEYNSKLESFERCVTINYANYGSVGFNIDVVPAVNTTFDVKNEMMSNGCENKYVETAIEIPDTETGWVSSNPQAYYTWFEEINRPFMEYNKIEKRKKIYESNIHLYSSEEEVPEYFTKSSLQMAIQLLKRARDVYFSKLGSDKEGLKPISAIISTIVLDTAKRGLIPYDADVLDVISIVMSELKIYSQYQNISEVLFRNLYSSKVTICRNGSKWEMWNPVNPKDNLVDSWNSEPARAKLFFKWIEYLERTLKEILEENNREYFRSVGNILGNSLVEDYYRVPNIPNIEKGPKPWRDL